MTALLRAPLVRDLRGDRTALAACAVLLVLLVLAAVPGMLAPHAVFDLRGLSLLDAFRPPAWIDGGSW